MDHYLIDLKNITQKIIELTHRREHSINFWTKRLKGGSLRSLDYNEDKMEEMIDT